MSETVTLPPIGSKVRVLVDGKEAGFVEDSDEPLMLFYPAFVPGMEASVLQWWASETGSVRPLFLVRFEDGTQKWVTTRQCGLGTEEMNLEEL